MEDANQYTKHQQQQQQLNQANPSKFYYHFLYKALIVSAFLIILALFPSQAPDFINQTLNTRGWEFLHLVFVGIAISYGLFSRRNDDDDEQEKENKHNNNYYSNAQSYVSRLLQVSSIFGEEGESPTGSSPSSSSDGEKFQAWSNQYFRNDPMIVVAENSPVLGKEEINCSGSSSIASEKPLLLPVRRLKSHSLGADAREVAKEPSSLSRSKRQEKVIKDQVVGPSPSPWRSIPGRIDIGDGDHPEVEELEFINRPTSRPQAFRSSASQPNSACSSPRISPPISSPRKLASSSASSSSETRGKIAEDFVRKKGFYRPPPPPPPPPPPQLFRKAVSMKQRYRVADQEGDHQVNYPEKYLRRSFSGEEAKKGLNFPRSVRTTRSSDWLAGARPSKDRDLDEEKEEMDEKVMAESEEDLEMDEDEEEDDNAGRTYAPMAASRSENEEAAGSGSSGDGGPDVDKKADEFIARFREQIRLQRIESIKKSSGQVARNSSR